MVYTLPINPGNAITFPWLSGIAQCFTQYRISGLVFYYKSTSGSLSTTQALGEVIMGVNYNTADSPFTNNQQMLTEVMATSKVPSEDAICGVEADPMQTAMGLQYIRGDAVPAGQDPRFYDIGTFYIAAQGVAGGSNITLGELWVSYEFEFYKPQMPAVGPDEGNLATHLQLGTTWAAATPLGTTRTVAFDSIGVVTTSTTITLPIGTTGTFMVTGSWVGANTGALVNSVISASNATGVSIFNNDMNNEIGAPIGGSDQSAYLICLYCFTITSNSVATVVTFGASGTFPGTPVYGDVILTQMPLNFK